MTQNNNNTNNENKIIISYGRIQIDNAGKSYDNPLADPNKFTFNG